MSKVAIVGTGFIGRAWAISFARAGHDVALWDAAAAAPADALAYIDTILPNLAEYDLLGGATPGQVRARMRIATTLEQALGGAAHVQENTPEDVEVKRRIFARLDAAAMPQAILASSTSAILPSQFTEALAGSARCLVVHPLNPPYVIPAAEVVPAPWTSAETVRRTADFLKTAGHAPIVMKRELDGFVMHAGGASAGGFPRGSGRPRQRRGRRHRHSRRPGAALELHGTVRDHRSERAGRRARLCRAL